MPKNPKKTSSKIGKLASETIQKNSSSKVAKSVAASALSQRSAGKQTGAEMEKKVGKILASDNQAKKKKQLAASVLSQANKSRK